MCSCREDPENEDGGFWSLKMSIPDACVKFPLKPGPEIEALCLSCSLLIPFISRESVWKEMCICLIGEQISPVLATHGDELHGVTVSIRKEYAIIQVWNKRAHPETEEEHIAKYLKAHVIPEVKTTAFFYKRALLLRLPLVMFAFVLTPLPLMYSLPSTHIIC
jgi:hypothetical protein